MIAGQYRHLLSVFADYNQFYIWDAGANPTAPVDYTDDDVRRMVKVGPSVVVVQPVRNMRVPVEFEVYEQDPGFVRAEWDHVAECGLSLPTGCRSDPDAVGSGNPWGSGVLKAA